MSREASRIFFSCCVVVVIPLAWPPLCGMRRLDSRWLRRGQATGGRPVTGESVGGV